MGRSQRLSKAKKNKDGSAGVPGRAKPIGAVSADREGPNTSPERREMNLSQLQSDDRVARARRRISEGYYDRDEIRRAIAEALMFVLSTHRD